MAVAGVRGARGLLAVRMSLGSVVYAWRVSGGEQNRRLLPPKNKLQDMLQSFAEYHISYLFECDGMAGTTGLEPATSGGLPRRLLRVPPLRPVLRRQEKPRPVVRGWSGRRLLCYPLPTRLDPRGPGGPPHSACALP